MNKRTAVMAKLAASVGQPNPSAKIITKKEMKKAKVHPGPTPWTPEPWHVVNNVKPVDKRLFKGGKGRIVVKKFEGNVNTDKMFVGQPAKQGHNTFLINGVHVGALNHTNAVRKAARL
jgi:hypothetical protein